MVVSTAGLGSVSDGVTADGFAKSSLHLRSLNHGSRVHVVGDIVLDDGITSALVLADIVRASLVLADLVLVGFVKDDFILQRRRSEAGVARV